MRMWVRRRQWHSTPVLLPGKSHGWRSLDGCSPWGRWGSDTTEQLHFHFSLSCIGEGNGNPLQCSCLENPRDGASWWAAVYGVAQSQTRLKWLSSSSRKHIKKQRHYLANKDLSSQGYGFSISHIWIRGTNMRLLKRGIFKPVSEMFLLPVNKDKNRHCQWIS